MILSKVDVGGSESFLQSSATVPAASANGYLIDGMDVSNLDGNGSQAIMYLDPTRSKRRTTRWEARARRSRAAVVCSST